MNTVASAGAVANLLVQGALAASGDETAQAALSEMAETALDGFGAVVTDPVGTVLGMADDVGEGFAAFQEELAQLNAAGDQQGAATLLFGAIADGTLAVVGTAADIGTGGIRTGGAVLSWVGRKNSGTDITNPTGGGGRPRDKLS